MLSKILQSNEIKCWLVNVYNWFKLENFRKRKSPFWNGLFKCIDCGIKFKTIIREHPILSKTVKISIYYKKEEVIHSEFIKPKKKRFSGIERKELSIQCQAKGLANFHYENGLFNLSCFDPNSSKNIVYIKSYIF